MRPRGFSLIELIVGMAVAAVLAMAAFPSYRDSLHRARRIDARLALQRIQYLQERHYASHLQYAQRLSDPPAAEDALPVSSQSEAGHYALSLETSEGGQSFRAVAQARADRSQARDHACQQFAVDQAGLRLSADSTGHWTSELRPCWS